MPSYGEFDETNDLFAKLIIEPVLVAEFNKELISSEDDSNLSTIDPRIGRL